MCGYIGTLSYSENNFSELINCNSLITCRGPDDYKELNLPLSNLSNNSNIFLQGIFNRLSIIDLSEKASQPMISDKYKTILFFNGEIFNHNELRKELEKDGEVFKTNHSDSEVVLIGLSKYGEEYIGKLNGQFAITFIDSKTDSIYLIRDRLGQKPLFYSISNSNLFFGSNLISVSKLSKNKKTDENQLLNYLNLGVVPSPNTIIKDIYKVEPGSVIKVQMKNKKIQSKNSRYWNISDSLSTENYDQDQFLELFSNSVNLRMESDVDVASFLSGGLDSTSIIKMLSDNQYDINSFSVGYDDTKYDESYWFSKVIDKYRTNSIVEILSSSEINGSINFAINSFDEPYSDPSIVPSYVISKAISSKYKVAISGDGGDELLGGYKRLTAVLNRSKYYNPIKNLNKIYPNYLGTGNRFLAKSKNFLEAYSSFFQDNNFMNLLGVKADNNLFKKFIPDIDDEFKKSIITDYNFYLSEMMMLKIDRTSMANSLEVRSPFVDHKLIEFIIRINPSEANKIIGKKPIKNFLSKDFDENFLNRKKMGFVFNLEKWIFSNISSIEDEINHGKIVNNFNSDILKKLQINKSRINSQRIWKLLIIERYLERLEV